MTKFKNLFFLTIAAIAALLATHIHAQTPGAIAPLAPFPPGAVNTTAINLPVAELVTAPAHVTLPPLVTPGQPFTVQGQTFLISTNVDGTLAISTSGPAGTNSVTPPANSAQLLARIEEMVNANNPANISYYGSNEYVLSIGGAFAQNSGQAAAQLSLEKYGLLKRAPNLALGAAVLEGNANGQNGTAGAYAFLDYRRPIGDVAFTAGLGAGWDNYNKAPMGIIKAEVEYRQNKHLGEYVGIGYAFEGLDKNKDRGLIIGGGIRYAF